MTSTDWSRSCGPIFMAFSDPMEVQDVVRSDDAKAERFVEPQRRHIGDLRADPQGSRSGDPAGSRDEGGGNAATAKRHSHADEVDGQDAVPGTKQLREAGKRAVALADERVVAARSREVITRPFRAAAIGNGARDRRVKVQPRMGEAAGSQGHHRIAIFRTRRPGRSEVD